MSLFAIFRMSDRPFTEPASPHEMSEYLMSAESAERIFRKRYGLADDVPVYVERVEPQPIKETAL